MAKKKTMTPGEVPASPASSAATARRRAPKSTQQAAADKRPGNGESKLSHAEIAEAAYYRHLNRSGHSGDEFSDWLEAERELRERREPRGRER